MYLNQKNNVFIIHIQIKFNLIKRNSASSNLFNFRKKSNLHPSYNPLSFAKGDSFIKKSSKKLNKKVSFSGNKHINKSSSQEYIQQKTTSNFNLETNLSTSMKKNSFISEGIDITNRKFRKIPLINISKMEDNRNNKNIKIRSLFRKSLRRNGLNSNNISKISSNRSKSIISIIKSKINKENNIEKGDYYKFTSIVFPPCIINNKKEESLIFWNENNSKRVIDEYDCLLKTYGEVKNEVLDELEEQKNKDIYALDAILKIKKCFENKKNELSLLAELKNELKKNHFENKYS